MTNGTDSDQYVTMTSVKRGCKRELEFALRSQSLVSGTAKRTRNGGAESVGFCSAERRLKTEEELKREGEVTEGFEVEVDENEAVSGSEGSIKSGIVDPGSDDERKSNGREEEVAIQDVEKSSEEKLVEVPVVKTVNNVAVKSQVEDKPLLHYERTKFKLKVTQTADYGLLNDENSKSKADLRSEENAQSKVQLNKVPKNLKELLETGLLEGLCVKYQRNMKARQEDGLQGVIKGRGVLCSCKICKGKEVVSPFMFELHAGSSNKRPPEYIFLENKSSLRDVINACKDAPIDALEATIRNAIGSASHAQSAIRGLACSSRVHVTEVTPSSGNDPISSDNRSSVAPASGWSAARSKPAGKITTKNLKLHKLVFKDDILPDGTEVTYLSNTEKLLVGYKSGTGIHCSCCNEVISPSQFEAHAGRASHRKPFHNIYTSNGVSLHELSLQINNRISSSAKENDNLCKECGFGGDLIFCSGCPRSFHNECLSLITVPTDPWYCRVCKFNMKEKFDQNANAVAAGRVDGIDPIEQIANRSIRIINIGEVVIGGCILCRNQEFTKEFGDLAVIICEQCEREFHVGCLRGHGIADLKELPAEDWFCCGACHRIHSIISKLLFKGEELLPDSLLSTIKTKSKMINGSDSEDCVSVKMRILSGKTASEEDKKLLLTAVDILHENFGYIVDPISKTDLIPTMVCGNDEKSDDFRGMHCALLTVNSDVVSVGVFRVFGQEMVEIPLVATNSKVQGQGYFQTLYVCLERFFGFLRVQKIVLPAANGAEAIWTRKFGFSPMSEEEVKASKDSYHLMTFQGLPWFKKVVPKIRIIS